MYCKPTSSTAITTSTESRLSRPRSPVNEASFVSCETQSDTLHCGVDFGSTHLRLVDLLKPLQHVKHSGGDLLLCEASDGRESRTLGEPRPPRNGSSRDGDTISRETGSWATESDTEERHFKSRCVTRRLCAECRGLRSSVGSERFFGKCRL